MSLSINDDLKIIHQFYSDFYDFIVGTDEAGRGPIAGPLVVAGVLFSHDTIIDTVYDSKKITAKQRIILEPIIKQHALAYHVEIVSLDKIKELNIYQASKWGMIECFKQIHKKYDVSMLLTDAMKILPHELPDTKVLSIIKGDQKSFHIAAASILAKVERDRIMENLHDQYPQYHWDKNKGYPTTIHREAIKKYGITPYHREGFKLL